MGENPSAPSTPPAPAGAPTPRQIDLDAEAKATVPNATSTSTPEIAPPLSIYESCLLLLEANQALTTGTLPQSSRLALADRILRAVGQYIDQVDRAYPTLPYYAWEEVDTDKVPRNGWGPIKFKPQTPIDQVTALSLQTHHEDVEIKHIVVLDKDGTRWEFNKSIIVPADQPRPEICFLPKPTRLAEVWISCRRTDPPSNHRARVIVKAGICAIPESAKQAHYHLQVARNALKGSNIKDAVNQIRTAHSLLREYQKSRRL